MEAGDRAPDFELRASFGRSVSLASYRGKKTVVLYFYPKDETPGCTVEACSFRDEYEDFVAAGAEVIGVSDDSVASHERFAARHKLPFILATDENGWLRTAMGIKKTLGIVKGRVTFIIDRQGVIRDRFESQLRFRDHAARALDLVRRLERRP